NPTPIPSLTDDQKKDYSKGLAEIMHNLKESQDFFKAAVDGRLLKFQIMEKEIIENQLKVLQKYPKDNERRQYIESQLLKDLEYTKQRIASGESKEDEKRRERMLTMHKEFLKLLVFFKEKWKLLNEDVEINPDPEFSTTFVVKDE